MKPTERVAIKIEEQMRNWYSDRRSTVFAPAQFVAQGLGTEQEVIGALRLLSDRERVELFATIKCDNDHIIWSGRAEDIRPEHFHRECSYCDSTASDDDDEIFFLRAEMSEVWRSTIDQAGGPTGSKKKGQSAPRRSRKGSGGVRQPGKLLRLPRGPIHEC